MAVTETTTISWGSRISGSFKGILVGLGLFIAGFPLLFWNEGRTVTATKTNEEGAASVVEAEVGSIDPAQEGALIPSLPLENLKIAFPPNPACVFRLRAS